MTILRRNNESKSRRKGFSRSIDLLQYLSPSPYIQQYVGYCGDTLIVEHYSFGFLDEIDTILSRLRNLDTVETRFTICIGYLEVIDYLHNHDPGPLVLCGNRKLKKYLKRFKIMYSLKVVLADVDNLTIFKRGRTACVRKTRKKSQAPEEYIQGNTTITEKKDIWRIPLVVKYILGKRGMDIVSSYVNEINSNCMAEDPAGRPTVAEVLGIYRNVAKDLGFAQLNQRNVPEYNQA